MRAKRGWGGDSYKSRKIRKLWRLGQQIRKYIVFRTNIEQEAYEEEERLIKTIGCANLTNLSYTVMSTKRYSYQLTKFAVEVSEEEYLKYLYQLPSTQRGYQTAITAWRVNKLLYLNKEYRYLKRYRKDDSSIQEVIKEMRDLYNRMTRKQKLKYGFFRL